MNKNTMKTYQIGIFGRRNVGKSSLINSLLGQDFAIVSEFPGTTTDPVRKRIELPNIGSCTLIDTAGIDDQGELGEQRIGKSLQIMEQIDLALIVFTYNYFSKEDRDLLNQLKSLNVPTILIHSKSDITPLTLGAETEITKLYGVDVVEYSCCLNDDTAQEEMRKTLVLSISKALNSSDILEKTILEGLVNEGDNIVLVCPIDSEAPQGRLILPETLAIRDALDKKGIAIVLQPSQLKKYIECNNNIKIVITDSQAFVEVASIVPKSIQLTSFSMLLARERGLFIEYTKGTKELSKLKEGSKVLILESCTHHATCEDIGRVKLPNLIRKHTGKNIEFEIVNGLDPISENMKEYSIVIQCGGCMVTKKQLQNRLRKAIDNGIPVTNYGMAIAYMTGIYDRAIKPLL